MLPVLRTMVVRRTLAGVVAACVFLAARAMLARGGRARVARVHLAVVARVTCRAVALVSDERTEDEV